MTTKDRFLRLFLVVAVIGLMLATAAPTQAQKFGFTAGLNFDRLSDITVRSSASASADATFDNKTGWHIGIWTDIPLGVVSIRPGVRYMSAGQLFEGLSDLNPTVQDDFDINLIEIPVLVRFGFGAPVLKPYLFAGPVVRFPAGVDNVIDGDLKSPTLAGEVGLGLQVALGGISLYPEIAYTFGLSSFIEEELILGFVTFSTDDSQKLNTAMLRLGVGL